MRRVEDTIRRLCGTLLATDNEDEQAMILVELEAMLHEHVQRIRTHLALYPILRFTHLWKTAEYVRQLSE
jgi:hypothetical protein